MRAAVVLAIALFGAGTPGVATGQEPVARARLADPEPVMVSSAARLAVEVLVPTFFNGPIQFPDEIELEGAIVILTPGASVNLNERIDGASWAGVRRTYRVYPLRPGTVTVDALPITISYMLDSGQSSGPTVVHTPPLELRAYVPDEARQLTQFFASEAFSLTATTTPEVATVRVGETLTRSYTMEARNTPGLFLPTLRFATIESASTYAAQPQLTEGGGQRGSARTATRREGVTYTFEQEGEFEIPGIAVNWWDVGAGRLREEQIQPLAVTVVPNPDLDAAMLETDFPVVIEAPQERRWVAFLRSYWRYLLAGLALLAFGRRTLALWLRRLDAWRAGRRRADAESEARYFREFVAITRGGDARQVHRAMTRWLDRWDQAGATPTLSGFAAAQGEIEFQRQVHALAADAFGNAPADWSGQALARGVDTARREHVRATLAPSALAPLNPS